MNLHIGSVRVAAKRWAQVPGTPGRTTGRWAQPPAGCPAAGRLLLVSYSKTVKKKKEKYRNVKRPINKQLNLYIDK